MTRIKKSRKSGVNPKSAPRDKNSNLELNNNKKPKKLKGKQAGNKQKEALQSAEQNPNTVAKDPRLGNKTPIALGVPSTNTVKKKKSQSPIAQIKTVAPHPNNDLTVELDAIEEDQKLQLILSKQETEQPLTEQDVEYFNSKMQRHQEICDILGISDEEDDETPVNKTNTSEDDLWDKLDTNDLSKFE